MGSDHPAQVALQHRRRQEFVKAGDFYTNAGHRGYVKSLPDSPFFGAGLVNLQRAALCYALAGRTDCRTNRCRQGVLIAEDMVDRVFDTDPDYWVDRARRGIWYEHIGDFRVIGEFGSPDEAYDRAIDVYRAGGNPDTFYAEQEQYPVMEHFIDVASAVGGDSEPIDTSRNDLTFVDWVERKREEYPTLVDQLIEYGEWP